MTQTVFKIRILRLVLALPMLAMLAACAASGTQPSDDATSADKMAATQQPAVSGAASAEKDPLICRVIKPTGSRFGQRTCLTQDEWSELTSHGQRETDKLQRKGLGSQPAGGGT